VTRKKEAPLLRQRLIERGIPEKRLWVPPVKIRGHWLGTQEQEAWWRDYRRANPNAIMIAWQFWTGADLLEEKICVAAKCFTPDVKIMGPQGPLGIDNIKVGDVVYGLSQDGKLILDNVLHIIHKPWNGHVFDLHASHCDITVTPDHDMLADFYRPGGEYGRFTKVEMRHLEGAYFRVPTYAKLWETDCVTPDAITLREFYPETAIYHERSVQDRPHASHFPLSYAIEDFIRLCGWFVSEGHLFHNPRVVYPTSVAGEVWGFSLTQNEGDILRDMEQAMERLSLPYRKEYKDERSRRLSVSSIAFYNAFKSWFGTRARNKRLPRFLLEMEKDQLRVLFDALMQGDGHYGATGQPVYSTSSRALLFNMFELGLKLGMRPNVRRARRGNWDIGFSSRRKVGTIRPRNVEKRQYDGLVWCVTTRSGTVLAGRNGRYIFTGQCPFPYLGSDYERQRMKADPAYYRLRTAWELAQGLGRTRRGRPEDYDLDGKMHGFVGIADGNWTRIKKVIPRDVIEAMVPAPWI